MCEGDDFPPLRRMRVHWVITLQCNFYTRDGPTPASRNRQLFIKRTKAFWSLIYIILGRDGEIPLSSSKALVHLQQRRCWRKTPTAKKSPKIVVNYIICLNLDCACNYIRVLRPKYFPLKEHIWSINESHIYNLNIKNMEIRSQLGPNIRQSFGETLTEFHSMTSTNSCQDSCFHLCICPSNLVLPQGKIKIKFGSFTTLHQGKIPS